MRKIRPILGFDYDITSDGKIFSYKSKSFLKSKNGIVTLWKNEKPYKVNIKDLVDEYFPYKHAMKKTSRAVLSQAQVKEMRRLRDAEDKTYLQLSKIFGVSRSNAYKVCKRVYWRDI